MLDFVPFSEFIGVLALVLSIILMGCAIRSATDPEVKVDYPWVVINSVFIAAMLTVPVLFLKDFLYNF